jgi:surface antigen
MNFFMICQNPIRTVMTGKNVIKNTGKTRAKRRAKTMAIILLTLGLGACETSGLGDNTHNDRDNDRGSREKVGMVIGSIAGAWLGSTLGEGKTNTLSILTGTILGTYLGGVAGKRLDERDREMASEAGEKAMESPIGQTVSWANPDTGNSGTVIPTRDTQLISGAGGTGGAKTKTACREFQQTVTTTDGKTEMAVGMACRNEDGTWRITKATDGAEH